MTIKQRLVAAIILACSSNAVFAEDSGAYLGIGYGISYTTLKSSTKTTSYTSSGLHILGGYQVNQNAAIEVDYVDLGAMSDNVSVSIAYSGMGISGVGILPVTETFALYGKMGMTTINSKATALPGWVLLVPATESKAGLSYGFGAQLKMTPNATLRLSLDSYETSALAGNITGRIGMYGAVVVFKF